MTPVVVTVLGAALTAVVVPRVSERFQTHQQQLDVRTSLASDMGGSFSNAILTSRLIVRGAIYAPSSDPVVQRATTQAEYTTMLRDWTVANAKLNAQLSARFQDGTLASDWRRYGRAVEAHVRLSGNTPDRARLLGVLREYVQAGAAVDWRALERNTGFKRDPVYLAAYDAVGAFLLARGEGLVESLLDLEPKV